MVGRQATKLVVDQRQEFFGGTPIAVLNPVKNLRDTRHGGHHRNRRRPERDGSDPGCRLRRGRAAYDRALEGGEYATSPSEQHFEPPTVVRRHFVGQSLRNQRWADAVVRLAERDSLINN
jgi:hypothetical protein